MRKRRVTFLAPAYTDLLGLYTCIAVESGHDVANGYIERIEAACNGLKTFAERGTRRDDLRPGLRIMGFERRATIAFEVTRTEVVIARVFYGGQDYERALRAMTRK